LPQRGWVRPSSSSTETDEEENGADDAAPAPPSQHAQEPRDSPGGDPLLGAALDEIDLELAKMICQPKNQWNFDMIRDATKEALGTADGAADRGRARQLLERIARFEEVRRQALGLPPSTVLDPSAAAVVKAVPLPRAADGQGTLAIGAAADKVLPPGANSSIAASAASLQARGDAASAPLPPNWEDPRFDGTGRLVPLEKRGDGDPQFLLVDHQGVARYFVTAAPGVNLRSYRDRLVGITGSRVEDAERGKPRLTALRVTVLPDLPPR
jgi:hypothetical protein